MLGLCSGRFLLAQFPVAALVVHSWQFFPLCADSAGGWAAKAQDVLHVCKLQLAPERRAAAVSLWRQRLAVALQQEGFRILKDKVSAALGGPFEGWLEEGSPWVDPLSEVNLDMLPVWEGAAAGGDE